MSMNGQLIFDVTYLAHWQGKLTGIPRVINELALRYSQEANVTFVVWDTAANKFFEVDIATTLKQRGRSLHYRHAETTASVIMRPVMSGTNLAVRILSKLKRSYRLPIPGAFIRLLDKRQKKLYKKVAVARGDTFLIPMGEWYSKDYIRTISGYKSQGLKLVQMSYDMLPIVAPQYSGHSTNNMYKYNKAVFPLCDLILAISEHTKTDVEKWLKQEKLSVPRIEVFRLGDVFAEAQAVRPRSENFLRSGLKGNDYLLCVGTLEARKNHTLLYYVYKLANQKGLSLPKLVIAGRRGWRSDDLFDFITNDPETREKIILLTETSDEELSWLYSHCLFSIYPSFYEGWGLPIAESIAHGTPCISSNTSSMPEVAGDKIEYFSPLSTDGCLAAIEKLLDPAGLKKAQRRIRQYDPTSWDESFSRINTLIRRL